MKHLSDEEIFELLAGAEVPAAGHLRECGACRARFEELSAFVSAAAGGRGSEPDWEAQRRAIMAAVSRPRRRLGAAVALAAGLLLAVGVSYFATHPLGPRPELADANAERGLAMLEWRPGEPPAEEFEDFVEFMIPVPEEDDDETIGNVGLSGAGAPAGGTCLG